MGLVKHIAFALAACLFTGSCFADPENNVPVNNVPVNKAQTPDLLPCVTIETDKGVIVLELNAKAAPKTVENFLAYCDDYFYDGAIFHRVVKNFAIQTGGYYFDYTKKEPHLEPVVNESMNGLKNLRGTVAMARHKDPDSARSQFFINLVDNSHLNENNGKPGYTVFGQVVSGLDVADAISAVPTHKVRKGLPSAPVEPIKIKSIKRQ